jgi:hypothetical protein
MAIALETESLQPLALQRGKNMREHLLPQGVAFIRSNMAAVPQKEPSHSGHFETFFSGWISKATILSRSSRNQSSTLDGNALLRGTCRPTWP